MTDYNMDILKNNIKDMMKKKNITQAQLADYLGMQQPAVSANLKPENEKNNFTVIQLINIAKYLKCSMDDLVWEKENDETTSLETLADILKIIFKIDSSINLNMGECETKEVTTILGEPIHEKTIGLYFDTPLMVEILKQWDEIKSSNMAESTKKNVIQLWQKDILQDCSDRKMKWQFRNEIEQCKHLIELAVQEYNDYSLPFEHVPCSELCDQENLILLDKHINTPYMQTYVTEKYEYKILEYLLNRFK